MSATTLPLFTSYRKGVRILPSAHESVKQGLTGATAKKPARRRVPMKTPKLGASGWPIVDTQKSSIVRINTPRQPSTSDPGPCAYQCQSLTCEPEVNQLTQNAGPNMYPTRKMLVVSSAAVFETPKSAAMMGTAALGADEANVLCEVVRTPVIESLACERCATDTQGLRSISARNKVQGLRFLGLGTSNTLTLAPPTIEIIIYAFSVMKPPTSAIFHFSAVVPVCGYPLSSAPHVTRSLSFSFPSGIDGLRLNAL